MDPTVPGLLWLCHYYRVSHNTVYTFVFWISRLPVGVEIPSWNIFQLPISCRFWKYPFFYYSVKFGPRYWQNTTGRSFQKLTFFVYYSMKQFSIHELSWVLMSSHKHSCALISPHVHSWALISMVLWHNECSWVMMSAHGQISRNNKKLGIFKIYTKWAVEKCPRWNFYAYTKLKNSKTVLWDII